MNLFELIENNKRMTAGLAAQSASSAQAAPDIIGRAVEAQMITGVAPSTVVQDPGGFQRLYQEQRNAGALLAGPITTEWMNEAPENAGLVLDEVPRIIDWELTSERLVREATGSGNISAAARSWWLSMRSMHPAFQLAGRQTDLEAQIDYLGTLRALEDQLNEGVIPNYEMLATGDGRTARASILQLQRYAAMSPEARAAERERAAQVIAGSEASVDYLRDVLRDYSESQGLLAAGRTVNFTDIRDFRSLAEWASFTGTQAVIDAGSALAIGTGGFLIGGPVGGGTAVFTYGTARGFSGITTEQAIQDAPYTTEEVARARLFGTLSGLTEVALGPSARFVRGAAGRALTREAYSEVSQEVLNRVSQGYLRRIGREVVASGVEEFFQEGAQYFLQKAGVEGADFRWTDETLLEAFNAAMAGMVGGGVVGGGMGARQQIVLERISRELRDAGRTVQNMEELANVTQDLQLAQRSPTKFQQLAERLGLSRVPVFFQAEDLNTYFQSQNKDPVTEAVKLGGTAEDFEAALASGGRISVTAEGLARAGLRGADGDFLRDNGSFTPAGSTPAEAQSINQTYNEIQQQIQEQSRMAEMAPERRQVYDAIYGQLRRAGRSQREAEANAALSTAFFETMAQRYGDDSGLDLYRRFGFRVEGPRQMARAEAAAEAEQLQIPDETVAIINDAITQAQAGGPVTLPVTPEVTLALQTLGVPIDETGTISAEDAQRLTGALQALEDTVGPIATGPTFEQTATIRRGEEQLDVPAARRTPSTREVAAALEGRQREQYGTIARGDYSDEAADSISDWAVEEVMFEVEQAQANPERSAVGWYSVKFQTALDVFGGAFPELIGDLDTNLPGVAALGSQQAARDFFTALIAITSDGAKVADNFRFASRVMEQFRRDGRIDADITFGGERNKSMRLNLQAVQDALDTFGPDNMATELLTKDTISNLKKIAKENGTSFSTAYKATMELPYAAVVFGPKLGAFYANLMGDTGYLTMDRWWSRTFNRYRGTLLAQPTEVGMQRVKDLLVAERRLNIQPDQMTDDEALAYAAEYVASYKDKGFKNGTELEKAANTVYKAAFDQLEDQPFNASDREFMVNTTLRMQDKLAERGVDLTVADIQAVLWYYEKRLYAELGARATADVSYEEIARQIIAGRADPAGAETAAGSELSLNAVGDESGVREPATPSDLESADAIADERRGTGEYSSGGLTPLEGAPNVRGAAGPDAELVAVAERYAAANGIDLRRQAEFVEVDPERAARIAQAYDEMVHAPQDPEVQAAYADLIQQTIAQYQALVDAGYTFTFFDSATDPYDGNPWNAMRDLRANKTMAVYGTYAGYGTQGLTAELIADNPMLQDTGLVWLDQNGVERPVTANDLFRAVHDAFGHGIEGAGFRARGEENAWQAHVRLFTGPAVSVLTSETRGQNSWLNYGPFGEQNRTASVEDTVFAPQKAGIMPEFTWTEGRSADEAGQTQPSEPVRTLYQPETQTPQNSTPEFRQWFSGSQVVDATGNPLVVYHGTTADITEFDPARGGAATGATDAKGAFFFAASSDVANTYAAAVDPYTQNPLTRTLERVTRGLYSRFNEAILKTLGMPSARTQGENVLPVVLSVKNPLEIDLLGASYNEGVFTDAIQQAKAEGYDGVIFRNVDDQGFVGDGGVTDVYAVFQPNQIKSVFNARPTQAAGILEQRPEGADTARGSITFPGGGLDSGQAVIRLFERADRSTFAHEAGHFFLEAFKQLSTDPQAPQGMLDDFRTINEYLGRDPEDTSEYTVDQQETWARSFEAYIMEGKTPSIALRSAFERFKSWLTRIYRQVVNLQVELSPEIRDVMDRMLATEEEIALVKAEQEISPLFLERPTGMDEADYDRYRKTATEADDEASQRLMNKLMARIRLQRTKTYNAERKALTTTVQEELRQTRTYQTVERLQTGETRLNRQQIVDQFGDDALREMNREKLGGKRAIYTPGGADLSVMAELMGYDSDTQMIDDLRGAQKFSIAVELEVNKRLDQKYGDLLTDGSIKAAARAAMHSDKRGQLLTAEANQLRKQIEEAGGPTPPNLSREAIKQQARDMIQDMSVRQAASPNAFLRAERKAAGEAQRAFSRVARAPSGRLATTGAQDLIAAHAAKRRQLLNHYLYVEARKAEELVAKMRKQSTRLQKKSTREAVASPYIDNIYALLEQYDFRQLSPGQVAKQQNLAAFVAAMEAADRAGELSIDDRLIQRSQRTHFSTLTVDELQGLKDTLDNLEHLGRTKMKLLDAKRERSYAEVQQSMLRSIEQNLPDQAPGLVERQGDARKRAGRIALNTVLSADAIINRLDGSVQGVGDVWRALKEPINDGLARVQVRKQQATEDFVDLFKKHYTNKERRDLNSKMLSVPEVGQTLPKQAILAIALNTGNRDNFERLTNPDNAHSIPRDQVQAVLDRHMDERDWRFVQDVWDYINSYWPEIAAQERALTGVNPRKVDSAPQITPYAFVKGGYFPIRYDPRLSGAVQDYDHNQMMENLKGGRFAKAQTRNGHTKERVSSTGQPLRLDLGIAIAHVNDVIYDLELRQPIQNSWRLLNDPQIDATFKRKGAAEDAEALKLWVQDVANGDRWSGNGWSAAYRHLRGGLSIAKMGFSITTLVQQPTGLLQSAAVVGKGPLGKALWKYKNNPLRNAAAVRAMSPFMEERQQTFQRDLTVLTESMAEDPTFSRYRTFKQVMSAAAFYLIQKSQFYIVDVPTWMAAYDTELSRNGGDTDAAASAADQIVARAQGSGLLSDRTAFERGTLGKDTRNVELAKLMTTFGSYMMAKFSVATQRVRGTDLKNPAEFVSLLVDLLMLYTIETAVAVFLTGNWPDFEDEEEDPLLLFLAKETGLSIMSGLPLAREAASTLEGFGGGGTLAAAIEESAGLFTGAYRMGEIAVGLEDEDRARAALKDVLGGMGVLFQLPTVQLERTLDGMFDDDMQFRDDFTAMDLLLGRRPE